MIYIYLQIIRQNPPSLPLQLYHSMLNNRRICPSCRSPLAAHTCKKCGYKQKILKVAEFQQEFGRINYANKIQTSHRDTKSVRLLTSEEKLAVYLKQYQKLLIKAVEKIIDANLLNITERQQFRKEVKCIWQNYLLKIRNNSQHSLGILKKLFNIQADNKQKYKQEEELKEIKESQQQNQVQQAQNIRSQEQRPQRKRGRRSSKLQSDNKGQQKIATKLRCYIYVSVKPLIKESIQSRKDNLIELTLAQMSFLSFLLGLREIDQQFLRFASSKYLKLTLEVDGNKVQKTFVKQSVITTQLKRRNLDYSKDRQKSIKLIMLFDILRCYIAANLCEQKITTFQQLKELYRSNQSNQLIDCLLSSASSPKRKQEEQYVPQISYQLIYSILYLSVSRGGLTVTISEIMNIVGALQISKINIYQDVFLPALLNQEVLTSAKIRRNAHLLAKYLSLSFPVVISRWCRKWSTKFEILPQLPKISALNRIIFNQVFKKGIRKRPNSDSAQKHINYFRFYQLQQDIASLSSLLVYLKLADGLSDYPYLVNINVQQLNKQYCFDGELFRSIEKLMKHKKIQVQNVATKQIHTKIIPQIYQQPFNMLKFTNKVMQINKNDKLLGSKMNNIELVKFRNLSHINHVPSLQLLNVFRRFKQIRGQKEKQNEIKLRYNEIPHQQWTIELIKSRKIKYMRTLKQKTKPKAFLSEDLIKQMSCIVNEDEAVVNIDEAVVNINEAVVNIDEAVVNINEAVVNEESEKQVECLLDEPSTNYQLMYEYTSDNLGLVQHFEQLHLMQQLCLNVCSFNEIAGWINTYESILKRYQSK